MAGRKDRAAPDTTSSSRLCWKRASACFFRMSAVPGDSAERSCTPMTRSGDSRRSTTSPTRCAISIDHGLAPEDSHRVLRLVLRRVSDAGGADFSSAAIRRRNQHLRNERLEHVVPHHRTVDRRGSPPQVRPSSQRPGTARPVVAAETRARADRAAAAGPRSQRHQRPAKGVAANVRRPACARAAASNCWSSTTTATRSTSGRTVRCWSEP